MTCAEFRRRIQRHWLWAFTAIIIFVAVFVVLRIDDWNKIAQVSDFVAGFSAALAFLWLTASLRLQAHELSIQRTELQLQRAVLENQAKQLKNSAKFSSLSQISAILERMDQKITNSGLGIKFSSEIRTLCLEGMKKWNEILDSTDPHFVQDQYLAWAKTEAVTRGYISAIATTLKIYLEHYLDKKYELAESDEKFVDVNKGSMFGAPYLHEHAGIAPIAATFLIHMEPGLKSLRYAGLIATLKSSGVDFFRAGALEEMRHELESKKWRIPAIAKQ